MRGDAVTCTARQVDLGQCELAVHWSERHLTGLASRGAADRAADHHDRGVSSRVADFEDTGGRYQLNVIDARGHGGPSHYEWLRSRDSELAERRGASQTGYKQSESDGQYGLFQIETLLRF